MVEFIIKRLVVTLVLALAASYALQLIEARLRFASDEMEKNGLLEHRVFHTPAEVYFALDELELSNLFPYLTYQFGDVVRGLFVSLVFLDVSTIGLRQVPWIAALDFVPLLLIPVNIIENSIISILILAWPTRLVGVSKVLVIFSSFAALLYYIVLAIAVLSGIIVLFNRRITPQRHSMEDVGKPKSQ